MARKRRSRTTRRRKSTRIVRRRVVGGTSRPRPPLQPVPGPDAFTDVRDRRHVMSQAATLLLIGQHLRGDVAATEARARAVRAPREAVAETIPRADVRRLGFPRLSPTTERFAAVSPPARLAVSGRARLRRSRRDARAVSRRLPDVARRFYADPNPETAAALLEVGCRHPDPLVRVAAAASYPTVTVDPETPMRILEEGAVSDDRLVRAVAAHALSRLDPRNPVLLALLAAQTRRSRRRPSHTAVLVHGTWARGNDWWQPPSGDFWKYLHDNVRADLYGAGDRFDWSGGYSDAARALGGSDLHVWVQQRGLDGLDVFAHSHGGSVSMLANQAGTRIGTLVLLGCPVHWPKYAPDFTRVGKAVSIRVHLDLVILADGGGQRFQDGRIEENVLPIWFDHFTTHDPDTWERYDLKSRL